MKKIVATIVACLSLSTLGTYGLFASEPMSVQGQDQSLDTNVSVHCRRGPRGHRGERGHHGRSGSPGIQGPQGPVGPQGVSAISAFGSGYVYVNSDVTIPFQFGPVPFTDIGPLSNVTYDNGTNTFTVNSAGTYLIDYYGVCSMASNQVEGGVIGFFGLQVLVDGVPDGITFIPGTPQALGAGLEISSYAQASNQIVRSLSAGTTVQLQARAYTPVLESPTPRYGFFTADNEEGAHLTITRIGD